MLSCFPMYRYVIPVIWTCYNYEIEKDVNKEPKVQWRTCLNQNSQAVILDCTPMKEIRSGLNYQKNIADKYYRVKHFTLSLQSSAWLITLEIGYRMS